MKELIKKIKLHLRLKKILSLPIYWDIFWMKKKEDKKSYEMLFDEMQKNNIGAMEDRKLMKELLLVRIVVLQKTMTYINEADTKFNRARLFELTQMYQLFDRFGKQADRMEKGLTNFKSYKQF